MKTQATVRLTKAQGEKIIIALDYFLNASDWDEQMTVFGNAPGIRAAHNAYSVLNDAFYGST